jgi:hypothetical protein
MTKIGCALALAFLLAAVEPAQAQAPASCLPAPSGLVAYWPAEGNANDIVAGHDGILRNGVTFVPGRIGQAFGFDGIDDFIEVLDEEPFDFGAGPFSVSVWVKTAAGRGFNEHVFSKGNLWTGDDDYVLWVENAGGPGPGQVGLQWANVYTDLSTTRVDDDTWHHVAVTESGPCAGCVKMYVDGVLQGSFDGMVLGNSVDPFIIGATYSWGLWPYKGAIDELAVFDRALSDEEVQSLFVSGSIGPCNTVRAWIGLKNSDDQGTRFDLGAALYVNDVQVAEGETLCIVGITRSPAKALEVSVPLSVDSGQTMVPGDVLSLKLSARVGTNPDGTKCPGHNNAVGLRLYYGALSTPSRLGTTTSGGEGADQYLQSLGGTLVLQDVPPGGGQARTKDSGPVNFAGGNPWAVIGVWSRVMP